MLFGNLQTAIIGVADLEVVWIEMDQIHYCGGKLDGNFGFVHDQVIFFAYIIPPVTFQISLPPTTYAYQL